MASSNVYHKIGGRRIGEDRYLFKNAFAGSKVRKANEKRIIGGAILISAIIVLFTIVLMSIDTRNAVSIWAISLLSTLAIGISYIGIKNYRNRVGIGTFLCELSTRDSAGKLERRFECTDERIDQPSVMPSGCFEPGDLELRGVLDTNGASAPAWIEVRLNLPHHHEGEPESIILLASPTQAHKHSPEQVLVFAKEALASLNINLDEVRNKLGAT